MSTSLQAIKDRIKQEIAVARQSFELPTVPRIQTTGKRFTLPNGKTHNGPLQAVILDWRNTRTYYDKPWNPNNPEPPKCYAIAKAIDDLAPTIDTPIHDNCAECPMNQWGSDPQGGKGKACANKVRLAVVPADLGGDTPVEQVEPMALDITSTGLKSWNTFVAGLTDANLHPMQVIAEIGFNADVSYPSLVITAHAPLDDLDRIGPLLDKAQGLLARHPNER